MRLEIVTESTADVFLTDTENETFPPGSGSEVGSAVFVTRIELGVSLSLFVTVQVFVSPSAIEPLQSGENEPV